MREAFGWRLHQRHSRAGLLALLAIVFLLGVVTGVALRDFSERSAPSLPRRAAGVPRTASPWWRTRFPPASVYKPVSLPAVEFDPANVLSDVPCGSLDGATLTKGAGAFLWGWAYDPRTKHPAVAVILFDNGRQLSQPVQVYQERPDVVAAMREPQLIMSGWRVWLPVTSLDASREHAFEAFALFEDHKLAQLGGKISAHE